MNKGSCFMSKSDSIYEYIKQNEGLCIVYGATVWGEMLVSEDIKIDYFSYETGKKDETLNKIYFFRKTY